MNRRLSVVFRRTSILGLAALLLIWQTGCAVSHRGAPMTPEEAGRLKSRLGAIAVVSAEFTPEAALQTPAKGAAEAFGKGAVGGAGVMLGGTSGSDSAGGAVIGLLLIPVGAVVGGVHGAIVADSAKDVN
ncbi:MAG: hypothetical protein HY886_10435 [Deltaproteobacteria bacterium]|nr:hypothetical protein [Deltaproteobacteria bacterium]